MDARTWFAENGYSMVVEKIDYVQNIWKERGSKTRRNWWQVMSGRVSGDPITIYGVEFPVLKVARERMGLPPVKTAVALSKKELAPEIVPQNRWDKPKRRKRK